MRARNITTPLAPSHRSIPRRRKRYANEPITYLAQSPNYYTFEKEAAQAIVDMWKQVGINAKLELIDGALQNKTFQENTRQVTTWSATSGTGDPDGYLWRNWGPDNLQQKNGWWTPESAAKYNQLGMQARSILDKSQRFDLYQQMLTEFEAPGTTLYIPKETYGLRSTIDWTPYPLYYMDLRAYNFKVK